MEPFIRLVSKAIPYSPENVDTDQILPGRFLSYPRGEGYGRFLFHDLRYREDGEENPDFVFNRPIYDGARIIVGNKNFGCGSSREGAVYTLTDYGIRSIIAPSFADIFFNNCLRNGIVPVRLPPGQCERIRSQLAASPGSELVVDVEHLVVIDALGERYEYDIDDFFRRMLMKGLDEIGLTCQSLEQIEAFEADHFKVFPWVKI